MKKVVIVMPTYNEAGNINKVIKEIFALQEKIDNWQINLLIVDDNSPDQTADLVKKMQTKYAQLYLITGQKQGLGKAYVRGFKEAIENMQANLLFEMDADLSHPTSLIPKMLVSVEKGADFVIGSRNIKGGAIPKNWGLHRKIFSSFGNLIVRLGFMNFKIHDWTSGYRAVKTNFVKQVISEMDKHSGYVFQIALLDKAVKQGLNIKEVPLRFKDREKGVSKIQAFNYIFDIFAYLFNNSSFIKYVITGFVGFIVDFGFAYIFIYFLNINKPLANLISAELAIVFNFFTNNFWSFKHKQIQGEVKIYFLKFLLFNLVSSGGILIQFLGMYLALQYLGDISLNILFTQVPAWIIYKILIIGFLVIPYSYFMYNKIIWEK